MSTGADRLSWGFAACLHRRRVRSRAAWKRTPTEAALLPSEKEQATFWISGLLCSGNIRRRFRTRRRPSRDGGIGRHRNFGFRADYRWVMKDAQLASGLLWLHRNGMDALMKQRAPSRLSTEAGTADDNSARDRLVLLSQKSV
jgi:hypothetical protein